MFVSLQDKDFEVLELIPALQFSIPFSNEIVTSKSGPVSPANMVDRALPKQILPKQNFETKGRNGDLFLENFGEILPKRNGKKIYFAEI